MTVVSITTQARDLTAREETSRAYGACLSCPDCLGCEDCGAAAGTACEPYCAALVEHEDHDPEADLLCGITPAVEYLLALSAPRPRIDLAAVTCRTVTRKCRHCDDVIDHEPAVGWVSARSGDEGGTYDVCDYAPNGTHRP